MLTKETVTQAMENLPVQFTIDDLFSRLDFIYHVNEGLKDAETGREVSHESVVKEYEEKWQKLTGQKKH